MPVQLMSIRLVRSSWVLMIDMVKLLMWCASFVQASAWEKKRFHYI